MKVPRQLVFDATFYKGKTVATFHHRQGWQVVCTDVATGKRVYYFNNGTRPTLKMGYVVAHNRTGPSKANRQNLADMEQLARQEADRLNDLTLIKL